MVSQLEDAVDQVHPHDLLPSLRAISFVCPRCQRPISATADCYFCAPCGKTYPLHAGIPDFRLFPDPYLKWKEDRDRTDYVLRALHDLDLPSLLEHYWQASDITPKVLRGKFIRSAMLGEGRAQQVLSLVSGQDVGHPSDSRRVLDIGSGTGNFLAVAAPKFKQVVGVDIGMRWLHVSRRRFMDKGLQMPPLVCCCAEYLPFPDGYFDFIFSTSTLEFTKNPDKVLSECSRVLSGTGTVYLNTANRYSLARDPYSYLWGVGYLPRPWQVRYVRWRRNASYENVLPVSLGVLRRLSSKYFGGTAIGLADIDNESLSYLPRKVRSQVGLYRYLKKIPLLKKFLLWVAPQWNVKLSKKAV